MTNVTIRGNENDLIFVLEKLRDVSSPNDYIGYIQLFLAECEDQRRISGPFLSHDAKEAAWDRLPVEMHAFNKAYQRWKRNNAVAL